MSRWAIAAAIVLLAWAVWRAGDKIVASIDFQTTMLTDDWTEEDQEEYEAENYR